MAEDEKLKVKELSRASEWNRWHFCLKEWFRSSRETKQIYDGQVEITIDEQGDMTVTREGAPVPANQSETYLRAQSKMLAKVVSSLADRYANQVTGFTTFARLWERLETIVFSPMRPPN